MAENKESKPKAKLLNEKGCLNKKSEIIKDELFFNYAFFDPEDLIQVKYEMIRRVQKDGWKISKASEIFGFSRPSFYEAKKALDKEGLPGLIPQQRGPKSSHKLSDKVMDYIEEIIKKDKALRPPDLIKIIEKQFGFKVHPRSMERALARRKKK